MGDGSLMGSGWWDLVEGGRWKMDSERIHDRRVTGTCWAVAIRYFQGGWWCKGSMVSSIGQWWFTKAGHLGSNSQICSGGWAARHLSYYGNNDGTVSIDGYW